ncbi:5-formyltetrahydrofolate cyclo-ligase isoform X2 [Mobula birostris]|uniref:5-formyltetrahydrofolate cyclo-ligase isoform X2 n=1 Tax=Mobula birostris TaxID=1983395 RepID=UPI003B284D2E
MAALRAAKKALRLEMKRRVAALSDTEKHRQSVAVSRQLLAHPKYQNCQRIAVFLSMSDEIQTEDIIKDVFQSSKECFIPRYKTGSNHMDMVKLSSVEEICNLPVTSWNIQQPAEDDLLEEALNTGGCLKAKDGTNIMEKDEIMNRWAEYIQELFEDNRGEKPEIKKNFEGPSILKSEVCNAISKMKGNRS